MADQRKIKAKEYQLLRQLEKWVKDSRVLEPGEQIVFTLGVKKVSVVEVVKPRPSKNEAFLSLSLADAFSRDRLIEAGCNPSVYVTKIHNSWQFVNGFHAQTTTVREMLERRDIRDAILFGRGWGKAGLHTVSKVRRVLEFNGVVI